MNSKLYNLTNPQKNIWNTEQYFKGTNINNICGTVYIKEKINFKKLVDSVNLVVKNNDNFNINFINKNNIIYQEIKTSNNYNTEIVSVKNKKELSSLENTMCNQLFSIETNKLFEIKIFQFPNNYGGVVLSMHHLLGDSWTLGLVCKEIISNYKKLLHNENVDKDNYSYIDYINRENKYFESNTCKKDKEYWDNVFKEIPEIATIPSLKKQKKIIDSIAGRSIFNIEKDIMDKINIFCKEENISIFNFLMTIFSIYIGNVSNLDNFVIGTPILNRLNFSDKHTNGMFVSTVPFYVHIDNNLSFIDLAKNIAKDSFSMLKHQQYPYSNILQDIRKKDSSIPNLYNIVLSYQITKTLDNEIPCETHWVFNGNSADDLQIHIVDYNNTGSLDILYDYKKSKYSKEDIKNLHNRIYHIIEQILNNNNISVNDIEIVTEKEKNQLLYEFNDTNVEYPKDKTIVDLFEEQVKKTPDNIAVVFEDQKLTYRELNEKANQLARYLIENGIKSGDIVGIRMYKSFEMIIGILAIIKCGCVYLPINMAYPKDRVEYMLKDSNAVLFLTTESSLNTFKTNLKTLIINLNNELIYSNYENNNLNVPIHTNDLIYIIYTSGSTGNPKGAMICHKNVVRLFKNSHPLYNFSEHDVWTMFHSVAFDFSVWEMYGALLFGGKLILVTDDVAKDANLFLDLLRKEQVTILNQTPTYFYNLLDYEILRKDKNLNLRFIIFGGEALKPKLLKKWHLKYPETKLINMYGITETTVHVTFKELKDKNFNSILSNIGKPIPTLQVYILNKNKKLLPIGVEGEMYVSGDGVCKGYLNKLDLTKKSFIKIPYLNNNIIYKSSDGAFIDKNGDLYYTGRLDKQIKLRGFRIELSEIEDKISHFRGISKCIVLQKNHSDKDSYLVAYIMCNVNIELKKLKVFLNKSMPDYMIPSVFIKINKIPINHNGKVDRTKLLELNYNLLSNSNKYIKARNPFEKAFQKAIQTELNIKKVGIDDDIFNLGADSLSLIRIISKLYSKNYKISIQDIYKNKTIRKINDNISNKLKNIQPENKNYIYYNFPYDFNNTKIRFNNILLTGATGFLGIHILNDIINNTSSNVYCLIRNKDNQPGKTRLINKLKFYFNDTLLKYINKRIFIINGNIANLNLGLSKKEYNILGNKIDLVIHSAAIVNHYGNDNIFESINVTGTKNIIDFCNEFKIKLNYISTISISCMYLLENQLSETFSEHSLYIGQSYKNNIYIKTKFEAEYSIWEAMQKGLNVIVYRIGNIMPRSYDSKFQDNINQNAFFNRFKTFIYLKSYPKSISDYEIDFSPVDFCSKIITTIMQYNSSYNKVFHIINNNTVNLKKLFSSLNLNEVEDKKFLNILKNSNNNFGLINDITNNISLKPNVVVDSSYTLKYLLNLNIKWPTISTDYLNNFINLL